jgi:hypothetical protein
MADYLLKVYGGKGGQGLGPTARFRAMTFTEASALRYGDHLWFISNDGSARVVKVNGLPKRWKRDPGRIEIPAKYGMYEYATFTRRDIEAGRLLVPA